MADNAIIHPLKEYKIAQVGPDREWDFQGDNGKVYMKTFSIQLEGIADWVDLNLAAKADAPKVGETLEGHVEDAGKYGLKFQKKKKQGGWSGGGKSAAPGAQWSAAFDTAASIVSGYFVAAGKKPKDIADFLAKVEEVATIVKGKVDALAGTDSATATEQTEKSESESGESPAENNGVEIDDVDEKELGKW